MLGHLDMIVIVVVLLGLVFAGAHIAIALGFTAVVGVYLLTGDIEVARTFVANTAYEALRDYVFAVIPLFMLMGDFLAKCGAARDLYTLAQPRQPMVSRPARGRDHHRQCAVRLCHRRQHRGGGCVFAHRLSGNAPLRLSARFRARLRRRQRLPRNADTAVGADDRLVRADRVVDRQAVPGRRDPGLARSRRHDRLCGGRGDAEAGTGRRNRRGARCADVRSARMLRARADRPPLDDDAPIGAMLLSTSLVILLIVGTLGAIWLGLCTPTEGAGLGAVGALILARDQGNPPARGLAGRAGCRPHLRAAAAAAVLRAALFARAVDDRIHRGRQRRSC